METASEEEMAKQPTRRAYPPGMVIETLGGKVGSGYWARGFTWTPRVTWANKPEGVTEVPVGVRGTVVRSGDMSPYPTSYIEVLLEDGNQIGFVHPAGWVKVISVPRDSIVYRLRNYLANIRWVLQINGPVRSSATFQPTINAIPLDLSIKIDQESGAVTIIPSTDIARDLLHEHLSEALIRIGNKALNQKEKDNGTI
jgi:hypothetical protein